MPDVEIKFRTVAELAGARELEKSLERQIGQAKALGKDYSALEKDLQKVKTAMGQQGVAGGLKDIAAQIPGVERLSAVLTGFGSVVGAAALGAGALFAAMAKGVSEFAKTEEAVIGLDAALAQNGLLLSKYRLQLQSIAEEQQKLTKINSDEWITVLKTLTQFGSKPETIGIDIQAVKNLAGLMNGDLQSAVRAYTRALQGNFDAFSRLGIKIDETLTPAEKLKALMKELERGSGQLDERGKGLAGTWQGVKNSFDDSLKSVGRVIAQLGILQFVMGTTSKVLTFFGDMIGGPVEKLDGLSNKVVEAKGKNYDAAEAVKAHADALKDLGEQAKTAEGELRANIQAIDDAAEAELGLLRKKKDLALAELELGDLSPAEKAARKGTIEGAFAGAETGVRGQADAEKLKAIDAAKFASEQRIKAALDLEVKAREQAQASHQFQTLDEERQKLDTALDGVSEEIQKLNQQRGLSGVTAETDPREFSRRPTSLVSEADVRAMMELRAKEVRLSARRHEVGAQLQDIQGQFPGVTDADRLLRESIGQTSQVTLEERARIDQLDIQRARIAGRGQLRREGEDIDEQTRFARTRGEVRQEVDRAGTEAIKDAARKREQDDQELKRAIRDLIRVSSGNQAETQAIKAEVQRLNSRLQNNFPR